ncbi:MAG TPA: tyrosine-type recombinase/integrase, partial [Rubrivivax sp.]|nr:tyrosine-type recombinase/integrase [Rubrivivax sp.]
HFEQAVAFKRLLADRDSQVTGDKLSKATQYATPAHLKRFFQWLAVQPGYRSKLRYSDAEYFNLSDKDSRVAKARRERPVPTLEQVKHVISTMPAGSEIERRNRALLAFALLTGALDSALASMKLKYVDLAAGSVFQDARDVKTKFSKTFTTFFFPVGDEIRQIVDEWVQYLRRNLLWGHDDPLFPATRVELGARLHFKAVGIERKAWASAAPIRAIFKAAFAAAGLPYYNPHSLRSTLVLLGQTVCQTPEDFKAWSQNLGHEGVLTTFHSNGTVAPRRQGEIIKALVSPTTRGVGSTDELAAALVRAMRQSGVVLDEAGRAGHAASAGPSLGPSNQSRS